MTNWDPFTLAVRRLYHEAGTPTTRAVARRTGHRISHNTVASILKGSAFPRWATVELLVRALHGEPEDLYRVWVEENERREVVIQQRRAEAARLRAEVAPHCETCQCWREEMAA